MGAFQGKTKVKAEPSGFGFLNVPSQITRKGKTFQKVTGREVGRGTSPDMAEELATRVGERIGMDGRKWLLARVVDSDGKTVAFTIYGEVGKSSFGMRL